MTAEGERSIAELARNLEDIKNMLRDLASQMSEEQKTQRHRINNIDTILAGQTQRFLSHDEKFKTVAEKFTEHGRRLGTIEDNDDKRKTQLNFQLLGILATAALAVLMFLLNNAPG